MARLTPSSLLVVAFAAAQIATAAELPPLPRSSTEPVLPAALAAPVSSAKSAKQSTARPRAISPAVASLIATNMPKFDPEASKAATQPGNPSRLAESEAPRNGIIRLPAVIVRERRPVIFKESVIYTRSGLADLAFSRYISEADRALNRWTLPLFGISARERALQMYREEERLRNMGDLSDAARIVSLTDSEAGMYVKRVAEQTYMRTSDFGWNGGKWDSGR